MACLAYPHHAERGRSGGEKSCLFVEDELPGDVIEVVLAGVF